MTQKIALVFPGQGSQYVNMGKDLYENFDDIKLYYDKASDILGYDIKQIIFNSTEEKLAQTIYTQPAVFLTSYVIFVCLKNKFPKIIDYVKFVAGHSLGEYVAVCVSKAASFEDTLSVVNERAKIMAEVSSRQPGGMVAVVGTEPRIVVEYCNEIKTLGFTVEAVNFNTPQQVVVAGEIEGINKFIELVSQKKIKCIKLNVSGAFHSSLMNEAQKIFSATLDKLNINNAFIPIIMNYDAQPHTEKDEIINNLKLQINHPVLWSDSVMFMANNGVEIFIECGPGKVLSGMIKKIVPQAKVFNVENLSTLDFTINNLLQYL